MIRRPVPFPMRPRRALACKPISTAWARGLSDCRQSAWRAASIATRGNSSNLNLQPRLSPSDFGYHNAVLADDETVRFFDFEYAGWDDPAKLVCDFFNQVEVP